MSSFYEDASLVMIPSGYKTSKVYSAKPTDGAGDLTFSRSNDTATRVASNGLIEKVRTNLVPYSEQFDNAGWTKTNLTITPNSTAAPDGTLTAETITDDATNGIHNVLVAGLWNTTQRTASVFAKAGTSSKVYIENAVLGTGVFADLSTNTLLETGTFTGTITDEGSGWFRITATHTAASPSALTIGLFDGASTSVYAGTGSTAFIWGAQMEDGDIATDYIATTSAAVSVGPVANVPRLDYLGSSCPRLLLERQRTNLVTFSEQFDNASYSKTEMTVTANAAISPDGTQNADKLIPSTNASNHYLTKSMTFSGAGALSVYAKADGYNYLILLNSSGNVSFNLSNGTATTDGSIVSVGNGWYRCTATKTFANGTMYLSCGSSSAPLFFNGAGDGTSGVLLYGFQLEAGAFATSYIPTLGAAVTRGADAASKTGISSLIGQTEGTLFADFVCNGETGAEIIDVSDGTESNRVMFYVSSGTNAQVYVSTGGSTDGFISTSFLFTRGTEYKIAIGYKANDLVLYINGAQIGTDTSLVIPATSKLTISNGGAGNYPMASRVAQALLFKTRLSNSSLAELTA
jgi:hypothetical protein